MIVVICFFLPWEQVSCAGARDSLSGLDLARHDQGLLWFVPVLMGAWITGDASRAIRIATNVGQLVAFAFIIIGLFRFFSGAGFAGLWLTFIGWFLLDAARSSYTQFEIVDRLRGVRVADVMAKEWSSVDADTPLQNFVDDYLLRSGKRSFIVTESGQTAGMITAHEVKNIEREKWSHLNVGDVMLPLNKLHAVKATARLSDVLEMMGREDVNQLPVLNDGHLDGIVSRSHILRLVQTRMELGSNDG